MLSEWSIWNLLPRVVLVRCRTRIKTQAAWLLVELQKFKTKPKQTPRTFYEDALGTRMICITHSFYVTPRRMGHVCLRLDLVKVLESESLHVIPPGSVSLLRNGDSAYPMCLPYVLPWRWNSYEWKMHDTSYGLQKELFFLSPMLGIASGPANHT